MLAIRMQRTGRKGHAHFRVVVQDSHQSPSSGKFVALVGNYDPHAKTASLVKDKIEFYLKHGAQPSDRAALLFKKEGIKLPDWVNVDTKKTAKTRNAEKLRKNQPAQPKAEVTEEVSAEAAAPAEETTAESTAEAESAAEEQPEAATSEETPVAEEPAESTEEK